ncbi:MAG TPA: hypothetical protein VJ376_02825, partial [Pseudomonadota bacterium]|nr:hypothetical protein [Pseudomonadota bacterium]
ARVRITHGAQGGHAIGGALQARPSGDTLIGTPPVGLLLCSCPARPPRELGEARRQCRSLRPTVM